jgi:AcrR family transcriptional regulator
MPQRDRRLEIMQAAEKLFATRRFHEITLDEVSRQAAVGKGTIYRYFRDKDDLFVQTAMNGFDELCRLVQQSGQDERPFEAHLLRACEQISVFFRRRQPLFRMMHSEEFHLGGAGGGIRREWKAHRGKLIVALDAVLARGAQEGAVRSDIKPRALAYLLLGVLKTHARELTEADGCSASLRSVMDFFLRGAAGSGMPKRDGSHLGEARLSRVAPDGAQT